MTHVPPVKGHWFHRNLPTVLSLWLVICSQLLDAATATATTTAQSGHGRRTRSGESPRHDRRPNTRDDYLVKGLEQVVPAFGEFPGLMYAGLIPTTPDTDRTNDSDETAPSSLMFWLLAPDEPLYTDTLVVWMNGGPGCSSLGGAMFEQGPVTIPLVPAGQVSPEEPAHAPLSDVLHVNAQSWTRTTAMLYLEQPVGTGFSVAHGKDVVRNETDVGRDVYYFLQHFYDTFGSEWRDKQLYLFGESYAGMYVPSIAHYIHRQNEAARQDEAIPLAGIAMGNGWMNALVQGPAVIDYAWWHGLIDSSTKKALHQEWENCKQTDQDINDDAHRRHHPYEPKPFHRFTVPDECGILGAVLSAAGAGVLSWGGPNAYDVTTWDDYLMLDDPTGAIHRFYNDPAVQTALNIPNPPVSWVECMPGAGRRRLREHKPLLPGQLLLDHDRPISVMPYVAELLHTGTIRVLVYNGDRDMTTNAQGSEMLLDAMEWHGANGWATEYERGLWLPGLHQPPQHHASIPRHTFGGYSKRYGNLEFLIVYNSGHLVPYNQDKVALDLVTRFLGNRTFLDKPLPRFEIEPRPRKNPTKHDTLQESVTSADDDLRSVPPTLATTKRHVGSQSTRWNVVWSILLVIGGFGSGYMASRWTNRQAYQVIPGHDK